MIEGKGYEGRVSLVTQELERGNLSLRLRDYRWSDRGGDICQVIYMWVYGPGRVIALKRGPPCGGIFNMMQFGPGRWYLAGDGFVI